MSEIKERPILFSGPMVLAILEGRKTVTRRTLANQMSAGWHLHPEHQLGTITSGNSKKSRFGAIIRREISEGSGKFEHHVIPCPYGEAGDRLWVRETWGVVSHTWNERGDMVDWVPDRPATAIRELHFGRGYYSGHVIYAADGGHEWAGDDDGGGESRSAWHPSIHMPRAACRILLEITAVRIERLQDITDEQAIAEGCFFTDYGRVCGHGGSGWKEVGDCPAPEQHHPQRNGWMWDKTTSHEQCLTAARWAFGNLWESVNGPESWDANPWVWVVEFKQVMP